MRNALLNTVAGAALLVTGSSAMAAGTWVPVNPVQGAQSMTIFGVNDTSVITGAYVDASGVQHGFVGPFSGTSYKSFDDPDGVTEPRALNNTNMITGYDTGSLVPWERIRGKLMPITKGGVTLNQLVQQTTDLGVFVGDYTNTKGAYIGYSGKKYKYSSAIKLSLKNFGYAGRAIDTAGDIGGWLYDSTNIQHGFIIVSGKATQLDAPGSAYTVVEGMNNNGIVSGQFQDSSGIIHGFLYNISTKKYTQLDAPGSTSLTQVWGISNKGVVAVSSDAGSFVYCMTTKGCPKSAGVVKHVPSKQAAP